MKGERTGEEMKGGEGREEGRRGEERREEKRREAGWCSRGGEKVFFSSW